MSAGPAATFKAKLLRPAHPGRGGTWAFLKLPKAASNALPRRGRTTVAGTLDGYRFQATLEPDGERGHWLKVGRALCEAAGAGVGDVVRVAITPVRPEPEPEIPNDFRDALRGSPAARQTWDATTTIARLDWIHWITSAVQVETRKRRIANACDMLASGKRRVCCFDPSGFYSKALHVPEAAGE